MNCRTALIYILLTSTWSLAAPKGQLKIHVVDYESGAPIAGAEAKVTSFMGGDAWNGIELGTASGQTDGNGWVTIEFEGEMSIAAGAKHPDYYKNGIAVDVHKRAGKWLPWGKEVEIRLRLQKNPVPMYLVNYSELLPAQNEPVGFDLIMADWVAPHGEGQNSDFIFVWNHDYQAPYTYNSEVTVTFSNPHDGIVDAGDALVERMLIFEAPADGYIPSRYVFNRQAGRNKQRELSFDEQRASVFRVRTQMENDTLVGMYGYLVSDFMLVSSPEGSGRINFSYLLNPDRTRNLEWNGKNLFKKR
jgi:hypothetical protein